MKSWMKNIPNIISSIRIALVFVFELLIINSNYLGALIVYAVAFLSDLLDGYLARRYNWITDAGKLLDPFADKLMLVSALVCFTVKGIIPLWIMLFIGAKEFIMCLCGIIMYKKGLVVEANATGKISTGVWTAAVILNIVSALLPAVSVFAHIVTMLAVALSLFAALGYAFRYVFGRKKETKESPKSE